MPQTFLAVRCCSCSAFQGIQRTQQSKYACKLCNTKQSITRVFASGTGKEVRLAVQTLNRARLEAAAVAQEEANAEYEAHYEQEHPGEYAEADGEYAEEAARCAQCGAATDDLGVDVGDGQLYCAACFAAYDAGDAAAYAGDAAPPPPVAPPPWRPRRRVGRRGRRPPRRRPWRWRRMTTRSLSSRCRAAAGSAPAPPSPARPHRSALAPRRRRTPPPTTSRPAVRTSRRRGRRRRFRSSSTATTMDTARRCARARPRRRFGMVSNASHSQSHPSSPITVSACLVTSSLFRCVFLAAIATALAPASLRVGGLTK